MALVSSKELIAAAQAGGYAIGAFNAENMEMVMAIVAAAEACQAPVLIQTTPSTVKYAGCELYLANVKAAAARASVPIAMHLDHGDSFDLAMRAFRTGYTSIMIDGSKLDFESNIALSRAVAQACHGGGVPVEAELGKVGGKEDSLDNGQVDIYTDPQEAAEFVRRTGVDFLAVSIGTSHGVYQGEPRLDLDRLEEIHRAVPVPLVLHGTSGVPDETVKECIRRGICKVNYATDLRIAYTQGVRQVLEDPAVFDPKKYGKAGMKNVQAYVEDRIRTCGSAGKA